MVSAGRRRAGRGIDPAGARVLLTGASSGIGRALALALAGRGARLVVAARRTDRLRALAAEIVEAGHPEPIVVTTDLSRPGAAGDLARAAIAALGGVDVLINNAGVGVVDGQARLGDDGTARASFETNFWSPLALAAAMIPGMRQRGGGVIVNVTSTVKAVPLPLLGYYGSAKSALGSATASLRNELRHTPVRVLEVVPGSTDTGLRDVDRLPWRGTPRTPPAVAPETVAAAVVRGLERGARRVVAPTYSRLPLEFPVFGRLVAKMATTLIDTRRAT